MEERFNRFEKRFDHMEGILTQLIAMVEKIHEEQLEMKKDISAMLKEQQEMKKDISYLRSEYEEMRLENDQRHSEIMRKLKSLEFDQEYTWGKTVQNEREIARLKRQQIGS